MASMGSWVIDKAANFSIAGAWGRGKQGATILTGIVVAAVLLLFTFLFFHTLIMVSGRSDISCRAEYCSDETVHADGTIERSFKAGCCAISILGECYKGDGTQDACVIPELFGNVTMRQCHRKLCGANDGCCARVVANDMCAKGRYTITGCTLDRHRFALPDGYGPGSGCRTDVECGVKLRANPLMDLCTRCRKGTCQVGPFCQETRECRLMGPQQFPEGDSRMASRARSWAQSYREWVDSGNIPDDEKYLYKPDRRKEAKLNWSDWFYESIQ